MSVRTVASADLLSLEPLFEAFRFKPYRNYRVLPRPKQTAVLRTEVSDTLGHADGVGVHHAGPDGDAFAVGRALEWDSRFFGVPMGRIEYVMAGTPTAAAAVVDGLVGRLRERGVRHISARVDVGDIETMAVLEAAGFRLMDALVTYTTRPRKEPPRDVREVGALRPFRGEDADAVLAITAAAYRGYRGRFHLDPHLPAERSDAFYLEWARQCINGRMADEIIVSEASDGTLLGYLAFRRREPVSSAGGVAVFGGGLGACRPEAPGAYAGLIRAGTIWAHEHEGVAECQTQNYNFAVIRIYEAVGAHYVRAEYTLHRFLD